MAIPVRMKLDADTRYASGVRTLRFTARLPAIGTLMIDVGPNDAEGFELGKEYVIFAALDVRDAHDALLTSRENGATVPSLDLSTP